MTSRDLPAEARLALKMALASSLGWWLGTLAGQPRPIFAGLVGLVALSGDPFQALNASLSRIVGVLAGVAIGIGLLQIDIRTLWLVVLGLSLGLLAGIPLRVGDRPNIQPAVSALFLIGLGRTGAFNAGVARLWETGIGAGVTLAVAVLVWPPDPVADVERRLERIRQELAADLAAVMADLAHGSGAVQGRMEDMRAHSLDAVREVLALDAARRALRLNPMRRGHAAQLEDAAARINLAARLYRHTRSIARDELDMRVVDPALASMARAIADAIDRTLRGEPTAPHIDTPAPADPSAFVIWSQLRQLAADLTQREEPGDPQAEDDEREP
ncbi:MAG TPA: FUSC family protein [Gaiellaceae bacterium]|nr:FUSC family protein [Gaiellaceae bacterium]